MATYTPNYNLSMPESTDAMTAFMEDYAANMVTIDNNLGGGGGGGDGHTIVDQDGLMMPNRIKLQFMGDAEVTDDSVSNKTVVTVGDFYSTTEKVIGKWIDDKPLYQITFAFTTSSSSGWVAIPTDTTGWGIDYFTVKNMSIILPQYTYHYGMTGLQFFCAKDTNTGQIKYNCSDGSLRDKQIYLTVQYTKLYEPTPLHLVEYIESSGTQYINTGITPTTSSKFIITLSDVVYSNGERCIFGVGTYSANTYLMTKDAVGGAPLVWYYRSKKTITSDITSKHTVEFYRGTVKLDGTVIHTDDTVGGTSFGQTCLFTAGTGFSDAYKSSYRLYSFQIYTDNILVFDGVPALDDNDVPCMYDYVSNGYFYNLGTGVFTAGPDV